MALPPTNYTFHSLWHLGASLAHRFNIPVQEIQVHGTWTSDCIWRHISTSLDAGKQVAKTFCHVIP